VRIIPLLKKKKVFFSPSENARIVEAIRLAEKETSGEIRVYVESKNPFVDPVERAGQIFFKLEMNKTEHRNAVLLYIAMKHRELALFADEGIYKAVGAGYWNDAVKSMIAHFSAGGISAGIEKCILQIGNTLKEKFPYSNHDDKNELPDEIVFGK
jgi:uncharacterized membrane protein